MADIGTQIEALQRQYETALRAEAVARDRAEQAKVAEAAAVARLKELGFETVEAAEQFVAASDAALQTQIASLSADLKELPV